jgi:hypothetical protein
LSNRREGGIDARHREREVMHAGSATLEESSDGRSRIRRLEELDMGLPDGDERDADPVRGDLLRWALGRPGERAPSLDRGGQVGNRDPYMVELHREPWRSEGPRRFMLAEQTAPDVRDLPKGRSGTDARKYVRKDVLAGPGRAVESVEGSACLPVVALFPPLPDAVYL